ncbi:bifunctional DNA primase/polymerase [Alicyclobacillus sendaiensis]|uniref:bifunctional DNA primase/polymerase n=1 Tax=Alicyclobacillus sendaiensis TaxID=192387 RepID=UPI0026F41D0D|nr:bifunctional DNA primase/polymerase [Alicyclobacillus sendaiensis]
MEDNIFVLVSQYRTYGLSVIPLQHRGKHPLVEWERWQTERPSDGQIRQWAERWPSCNWGVVTGAVSGVVVLDLDSREAIREALRRGLPKAPLVATARGVHLYFAHPGWHVQNKVKLFPGADVRGDGGYVCAPPSVHKTGRPYTWRNGHALWDIAPPPMPAWLCDSLRHGDKLETTGELRRHDDLERIALGVSEGERNSAAARLAGYLLRFLPNPHIALALMEAWNLTNSPPLPVDELHRVVNSIAKREARRRWTA